MKEVNSKDIAIVIPARLNSRRLANKLLLKIGNLEVIEHVRRRAMLNSNGIDVFVVSGDKEIINLVKKNGGNAIRTYKSHLNGFSRCVEAHANLGFRRYILLQGDELLVDPINIDLLSAEIFPGSDMIFNTVTKLRYDKEIYDTNVVKCLLSRNNEVQLMFRKTPLVEKINSQKKQIWKVCGLFGYTSKTTDLLKDIRISQRARLESIEQLSFLDNGIRVKAIPVKEEAPSINVERDIRIARNLLETNKKQISIWKKIAQGN